MQMHEIQRAVDGWFARNESLAIPPDEIIADLTKVIERAAGKEDGAMTAPAT